jgi:oligopeptide/dipeptide ABC transporter ATP-binding protein
MTIPRPAGDDDRPTTPEPSTTDPTSADPSTRPVLQVTGLRKRFSIRHGRRDTWLTAIDGVDLDLYRGETVALVGESGSGKSTLARCVARLVEPTSGEITLDGRSLTALPRRSLWTAYRDLQMVFQDPNSSLNPRRTVRATLDEPLRLHSTLTADARAHRVLELLGDVGLDPALADRYPAQLSGGQRQRVGIARALAVEPQVVLLDEPTASLDVSVRQQVLDVLARVQREHDLAYLFISHDLEVVRRVADRVLVMYLGAIVEQGPTADIFDKPTHPYTKALLSSATVAEYGRIRQRFRLRGEAPSPVNLPSGCRLSTRCPLATPDCSHHAPPLIQVTPGHLAACPITTGPAPVSSAL